MPLELLITLNHNLLTRKKGPKKEHSLFKIVPDTIKKDQNIQLETLYHISSIQLKNQKTI